MQDGLLPEDDPMLKLEVFEGPLDLLLHLVKLNEVNILDLPMELITRQYLETLRSLGKMELPIAGEYFVMAADLLKIKSQMLLPRGGHLAGTSDLKEVNANAGPDPRAELIKQLLDYQKLKANAALLEQKIETQALSYPCLRSAAPIDRPLKPFDRFGLMGSYAAMMRRLLERVAIGEIALDQYTISQSIEDILQVLKEKESVTFGELLKKGINGKTKELPWMAAMFVALLELTRLGEIDVCQTDAFGEITLVKKAVAV